jgi:hypothetical protein
MYFRFHLSIVYELKCNPFSGKCAKIRPPATPCSGMVGLFGENSNGTRELAEK